MQAFIIPLLFIFGITYLNMFFWKESFAKILPFAFMECITILFLTGFFNLKIGYFICAILSLAGLIMLPIMIYRKKKTGKETIEWYFNYETVLFIALYIFLFVLNFRKGFYKWDDFSHWGVMAKETYRLNQFYYVPDSVVSVHKEYPPLNALLQYLWCNLCGEYSESALFNVKQIFCFSFLFPIIDDFKFKWTEKWYKSVLNIGISVVILCTSVTCISIGEASFFRTIYPEYVLALLIFYGFYLVYSCREKTWYFAVQFTLMGICLLMTKQIAFYFWGVLIAYAITKFILDREKMNLKNMMVLFCTIVIPFLTWSLYSIIANKYAPVGQFDTGKFSVSSFVNVLLGNGEAYQSETLTNYISKLFEYPLQSRPIVLSYVQLILVCLFLIVLLYYFTKERKTKNGMIVLGIFQFLAMIGYIGVILVSYLFGFSISESVSVVCFNRYMLTLVFPILLLNGMILAKIFYEKNNISILMFQLVIFFLIIVLLYTPEEMIKELKPGILCENKTAAFEGDADLIKQYTKENARIYLICQEDNGSIWNMIAYETTPRNYVYRGDSLGKPYSEDDEYTLDVTVQEWKNQLTNFDYLYLSNVDKQFKDTYGELFSGIQIRNQQLYKIHNDNGALTLELIVEKEW